MGPAALVLPAPGAPATQSLTEPVRAGPLGLLGGPALAASPAGCERAQSCGCRTSRLPGAALLPHWLCLLPPAETNPQVAVATAGLPWTHEVLNIGT